MDVFSDHRISDKKTEEFVKSIKAFKLISEVFEVKELRACATSAMRVAENGKEIQKKIKKETGVNIEIIDGKEEAEIIFANFIDQTQRTSDTFVVIDVGGGSTEISIFQDNVRSASRSFKLGTIRLLKEMVDSKEWDELKNWLSTSVEKGKNYTVYGTGGNINKIHKILGKKSNESVKTEELADLYKELKSLDIKERIENFKLKPDRADVIVPASKIFLKVLNQLKVKEMEVPKIGLSDGIIYQLHKKHFSKEK